MSDDGMPDLGGMNLVTEEGNLSEEVTIVDIPLDFFIAPVKTLFLFSFANQSSHSVVHTEVSL